MTEIIEGHAVEVIPPERAIVPAQPGQALVAAETPTGPAQMIAKATALADALSAMVTKQKLYTEIRGKKYPHVEAWQTIGRMDNVVARESQPPIRHEDGSYEAFVELIRLSDGMVVGGASALCGTKDDSAGRQDWSKASEPSRRSMASTRAISRAFRGQYAWIMALAGYEPTPADEMPDERGETHQPASRAPQPVVDDGGLVGKAFTQGTQDYQLRQGPDGMALPFRVRDGRSSIIVVAHGRLADVLAPMRNSVIGQTVTVWGVVKVESFQKDGRKIEFRVMTLERIQTPDGLLPSPEAESVEMFSPEEQARIDDALAATA